MEEINWLRRMADFMVNINRKAAAGRDGNLLADTLESLCESSTCKQVYLAEKLDKLTARILFMWPINSRYEIAEPEFLNIERAEIKVYESGAHAELTGLFNNKSQLVVLPLGEVPKNECIILEYDDAIEVTPDFREFLTICLGRIREISRFASAHSSLDDLKVRFNGILQTVPQSIVFIDNSGQSSWVNEPASKLFNLNAGNVEPSKLAAAMNVLRSKADNHEEIFKGGMQLFQSLKTKVSDWKWIFSDPEPLVLNVCCTPSASANISGVLWMFDDVTQQYLYEKQLTDLNAQLKEISQYKSQFLANMSHELRTPLNSILILADLLAENINGNLTAKQVGYAEIINRSGTDLLLIINDILDLSKIEAGKMDLVFEHESVASIVRNMHDLFAVVSKEKQIHFSIQTEPDVRPIIYTDRQRLEQIIKNLLSNAFKFTPENGHVSLHLKNAPFAENRLLISVTDTGIGVEEEKKQLIFEAFKQANGTTSRTFGGTGLGLSISKELIWKFGGEINLDSVAGEGSTFTIELPIDEPIENAVEEETSINEIINESVSANYLESLQGKKILVADDDMRNLFALNALLSQQGIKVITAIDGHDALNQLRTHADVDLILMDMMMPKMDGYEAMTEIRKEERFKKLPIIALTAKALSNDLQTCIEAGASDYMSKPFVNEQLIAKINGWISE